MAPKVSKEHFETRRKHILDRAKKVFKRKGYEPVTMQDIVEEAEISRGNLYQYFQSTEDVFRAIMTENDRDSRKYIETLPERFESIWDALNDYMNEFMSDITHSFGIVIYEFSVTSWRNKERKAFIEKRITRAFEDFIKLFQIGVDRGEFKPIQPLNTIVNVFISHCDGLILYAMLADHPMIDLSGQMEGLKIYLKTALSIE